MLVQTRNITQNSFKNVTKALDTCVQAFMCYNIDFYLKGKGLHVCMDDALGN